MDHRIPRPRPGSAAWRRPAAARLVTGPLAHFYAGALDWVALLARYCWARVRGRDVV